MNIFEKFVIFYEAPLVLIFGLIGNIIGLRILLGKKLKKQIGPIDIYRYLLLVDSLYVIQIIPMYLVYAFGLDFTIVSLSACNFIWYFNYIFSGISPWLLVYISIERLISIKYTKWKSFLRNRLNQLIYFILVLFCAFVVYIPIFFYSEIFQELKNSTNNSYNLVCTFNSIEGQLVISITDLIIRVVLPFFLMLISSIVLIVSIFSARKLVKTPKRARTLKRDVRFSITSILLNCIYLLFCLPVSIYIFIPFYYQNIILYTFLMYFYYTTYAVNFYLMFFSNRIIRKEFFRFVFSSLLTSSTTN